MLSRLYNRIYENPKYLPTGLAVAGGLIVIACVIGAYVYLTRQEPNPNPQELPRPPAVTESQPKFDVVPQTISGETNSVALPEDPSD